METSFGARTGRIDINVRTLKRIAEIVRDETGEQYNRMFKRVLDSVAEAVSYLKSEFNIVKLNDLPSQTMLTVLSVFQYFQRRKPLSMVQKRELRMWFWRSALSNRYIGSGYNQNIGIDSKRMKELVQKEKRLSIPKKAVTWSDFKEVDLKAGRSTFRNIIRQVLWQQSPKFINGVPVQRTDMESKKKKPEDDHFFPFHLSREGILDRNVNNILNLHVLDGTENIRKGKLLPSKWLEIRIEELKPKQRDIEQYFISQLLPFQTLEDLKRYEKPFREKRSKKQRAHCVARYRGFLRKRFYLFRNKLNLLQQGK